MAQTLDSNRRDFRISKFEENQIVSQKIIWKQIEIQNLRIVGQSSNSYKINYEIENVDYNSQENQYWRAFFVEIGIKINRNACYNNVNTNFFYLTTETFITPDIYPVSDCFGSECNTKLI